MNNHRFRRKEGELERVGGVGEGGGTGDRGWVKREKYVCSHADDGSALFTGTVVRDSILPCLGSSEWFHVLSGFWTCSRLVL